MVSRPVIIVGPVIGDRFDRILDQARDGDPEALEAIYRDLAPAVLGYLRAQGAAEPEDLASDVFVAAVRGLSRFRGDERSFRAWIFTIAHRRLVDERRRLVRRRERSIDPFRAGELVREPGGDVEAEALERLGSRWVADALGRLTSDQRTVLFLRVIAGLSLEEVAGITGKRLGAVKALQRRGLLRLARAISRTEVG